MECYWHGKNPACKGKCGGRPDWGYLVPNDEAAAAAERRREKAARRSRGEDEDA